MERTNLPLTKEIGSYSLTALGILLGKESTPAGIAATCVQTVYDKFYGTKTKGLSYKTKIYTHKSYSTGNTPSGYCEKQVTTWYSQKNYTGTSVTTIQFKNGYLY